MGTDLCVVSAGHDTAGLSPVSMRRGVFERPPSVGRGFTSRRRSRTRGALPILLICSLARLRGIRHRQRSGSELSRRRAGAIFKSRHRSEQKGTYHVVVGRSRKGVVSSLSSSGRKASHLANIVVSVAYAWRAPDTPYLLTRSPALHPPPAALGSLPLAPACRRDLQISTSEQRKRPYRFCGRVFFVGGDGEI